jgi:glucose-1-phosphate thymidylyltransferase
MRKPEPSASLTREQQRAAESGIKGMVPVGRPFLEYLLGGLADSGFEEACLVIGPEHDAVRDYLRRLAPSRLSVVTAVQPEARGTADAVAAAEPFAGAGEFLVINSDNYYPPSALQAARQLAGPGLVAFSARALIDDAGVPAERVAAFPSVETDAQGFLTRLAPGTGSGYVSMNCWRFDSTIFAACRAIPPSPRGELELPDAVRYSIERLGTRYRVIRSDLPVLDLSSRGDIERVTRQLAGVPVRL